MPRATTKPELTISADAQFTKLWHLIDSLTEEERNAAFNFGEDKQEAHWKRDKNLRDVLVHLYEWHQLLLNWVSANRNGENKPFLPSPYNWKTYGGMNVGFTEKHRATPYADAKAMLLDSHQKVMALLDSLSDDELFQKGYFSWTGTSTLGSYCVSVTASHYDWAMKKIKAHRAAVQKSDKNA
ncbi:MAG: ClbS/DfsB family four-helix bundle protein [Oscillospiraceae bacterium]|jgi:hypothetical protein|nr:ClbS/DfsB family four-helix bundle protein [Oscillospiraceae bacterium]